MVDDEDFRRDVASRMPAQVERMLNFKRGVATIARTVEELAADFRAGRLEPPAGPAVRFQQSRNAFDQ